MCPKNTEAARDINQVIFFPHFHYDAVMKKVRGRYPGTNIPPAAFRRTCSFLV